LIHDHKPEIILIQESMGFGRKIYRELGKLLLGWEFIHLDAKGRFGGLISGWRIQYFSVLTIRPLN
jgi:hypothetical protein